jgi:hypothetical protein
MRRLFHLPALSLMAWVAWLGLLAVLGVMSALQVWHPHFLPVTVLVVLLVGSSVALLVFGLWRLVFGPLRLRALAWLMLGVAPVLFFAGFILYGLEFSYGWVLVLNLPMRMLVSFGGSMFDLLARFQYPVRTVGETVVMISKPVADAPARVAAMDRHVKVLCRRLGVQSSPRKIHWVHGNLLGVTPHALNGLCLTSEEGPGPADTEGLTTLDRHEVAHCVLSGAVRGEFDDPPSVLCEGWAEANEGEDETTVALRAWRFRESGEAVPLRELTGPFWYSRHQTPAYFQGAALVNYILRTYGPAKFLELYQTCRQATFADDVRRVLGVSLDELDVAYWAEVKQTAYHEVTPAALLRSIGVRPPVDRAAWNAFLAEYLAAAAALTAPYHNVDLTTECVYNGPDEHAQPVSTTVRFHERHSGELSALRVTYPHDARAFLATPARSFEAWRQGEDAPWQVADRPRDDPGLACTRVARQIANLGGFSKEAALLLAFASDPQVFADASKWSVTTLQRFTEGGRHMVRLRLEPNVAALPAQRPVTLVFNADDKLAVWSSDIEVPGGIHLRAEYEYDHEAGVPLLRSYRYVVGGGKGAVRDGHQRVVERRFGPVPASEFTEARLLDGPATHTLPVPDEERYKESPKFGHVYRIFLALGVTFVVAGLVCGLLGGFRRQARTESIVTAGR